MAEYIEREAALNALCYGCCENGECEIECAMWDAIASIHAADVAPVVRCRDCKHAYMTVDGLCKYCDQLIEYGVEEAIYFPGDYFCADGERKDGDGDV